MASKYRAAYAALGEERAQKVEAMSTKIDRNTTAGQMEISEADQFWILRRDRQWCEIPGGFKKIRKTKKKIFQESVTQILLKLEPESTFSPLELWRQEKLEEYKRLQLQQEEAPQNRHLSKKEQIRQNLIAERKQINLLKEVTYIRYSKDDLRALIPKLKFSECKTILLVEILHQEFSNFIKKGNKKGLFEVIWAIEAFGQLPRMNAPYPKASQQTQPPPPLVYDSFEAVERLLVKAKEVMTAENDLIRYQLVDMSNCLPPLSKLTFGFKLDNWQRQALTWIDHGESVVICAPTSSGKTVLSTYVSVIFKVTDAAQMLQRLEGQEDNDDEDHHAEQRPREGSGEEDEVDEEEDFEYEVDPEVQERLNQIMEDIELNADVMQLVADDRIRRGQFKHAKKTLPPDVEYASGGGQKVLFVVPTEPLVWQVAAYFTKLLRKEGDHNTKVALVTDHLTFVPTKRLNVMPQIVVGTPFALESALTKPRGLFGPHEANYKAAGDQLPGGFDHFDWVIYDEVHSLDGVEGAALQRLIRAMNCPFLALSATIGNAEELRHWMEVVRGDQVLSVPVNALTIPTTTAEVVQEVVPLVDPNVHMLVHQVRFINLQRFIWNPNHGNNPLQDVSPLAAVPSVRALREGILRESSLSFTSKDSYRVWKELEVLFPGEAKQAIAHLSPSHFFTAYERITLARSKAYEDMLKQGLAELARDYPVECRKLLDIFQVENYCEAFDLTDIVLELRKQDMLPCLAFHLNSFEAIKLFQQVLSGLEHRQKCAYPNYYTQAVEEAALIASNNAKAIKACGGNTEKIYLKIISGEIQPEVVVDVSEPHPAFMLTKGIPLSNYELDQLLKDMERYDGFEKRSVDAAKTRNEVILRHALVRGLRRGVGLFIDEVAFPSYRRAVQKLASSGKLGLVISDSSLAFGVNMPFRTTVFCGEMRGELDALMAQQMAGRAGRRGLDTQGNIVYAGIRMKVMHQLMIGQVCHITGEHQSPRYESLFLQSVLSPRYTGYARVHSIAGQTLHEFIANQDNPHDALMGRQADEYFLRSKRAMEALGFVTTSTAGHAGYVPNIEADSNYGLCCIIWELRKYPSESITIGMLMRNLVEEFAGFVDSLKLQEKQHNAEAVESKIQDFFTILVQLVCRKPYREDNGGVRLLDLSFFANNPRRQQLFHRWAALFAAQQADIPEEFAHLRDPVIPGTDLDGTFFQCAIDRNFVYSLNDVQKQNIKQQIWHVGTVLKTMNNGAVMEEQYNRTAFFLIRDAFEKLRYLNMELISEIIEFPNICDSALERRRHETDAVNLPPKECMQWTDLDWTPWHEAMKNVFTTCAHLRNSLSQEHTKAEALTLIHQNMDSFATLQDADVNLIVAMITSSDGGNSRRDFVRSIHQSSFVESFKDPQRKVIAKVGVLIWWCVYAQPHILPTICPYLTTMYSLATEANEQDIVEEAIKAWYYLDAADVLVYLPTSYHHHKPQVGMVDVTLESSLINTNQIEMCRAEATTFIHWLENAEEEEEED